MPREGAHLQTISANVSRRLFLEAQGLCDDPLRRASTAALRRLVQRMGLVQIDTINVVERAHHLTLFSRLHGYRHDMLAHLLEKTRDVFEHWTHDASVIPTNWFPHWRHTFERYRQTIRKRPWWQARLGENPDQVIDHVRQRIINDGPLQSRDFEHDRNGQELPEKGWWGWKPQKAALEHLWRSGELAVTRRINFRKVYDLMERVLPDHHACPASDEAEHLDWACRSALERLVIATPGELAAFWHAVSPQQARAWCLEALGRGEITEVCVQSMSDEKPRRAFARTDWKRRARNSPEPPNLIRLLSPFDPVLRDRRRTMLLFGFDYTFEAFVPAPRRRYGYYVMPILEGDRLIGRLDPKFHRDRSTLHVNGLWWEKGVKPTRQRRARLDLALHRLGSFIGAGRITYAGKVQCRN
jgi:uncharacterized protein YcaQ